MNVSASLNHKFGLLFLCYNSFDVNKTPNPFFVKFKKLVCLRMRMC